MALHLWSTNAKIVLKLLAVCFKWSILEKGNVCYNLGIGRLRQLIGGNNWTLVSLTVINSHSVALDYTLYSLYWENNVCKIYQDSSLNKETQLVWTLSSPFLSLLSVKRGFAVWLISGHLPLWIILWLSLR